MLNIVLFGLPGAGKGTQSQQIIQQYNLTHIAPGDIFREQMHQNTPLGKQVATYINNGKLVPDRFVVNTVETKIDECLANTAGFLFDGYPRTQSQAIALDAALGACGTHLHSVIFLVVSEEEARRRIRLRSQNSDRTDDANEASMATRMKLYLQSTLPVANYYEQQKKLVRVAAEGTVAQVAASVKAIIKPHAASTS